MSVALELVTNPDLAPPPEEVQRLYVSASAGPPLKESGDVGALYARIYASLRQQALVVRATAGQRLVGICYGHRWAWSEQFDTWALELANRLGAVAARAIDGTLGVRLLAVEPEFQRRGIGRNLLRTVCRASKLPAAWLETTDIDSPARRLYQAEAWRVLGYGPDAPNELPGVVLYKTLFPGAR